MINSVERLVSLADDMELIRPGKDGLKIFFIVSCIDTLYKVSASDIDANYKRVIDFFVNQICEEDKKLLSRHFWRSMADERCTKPKQRLYDEIDKSMETFARLVYHFRNLTVHEGEYWKFSFNNAGFDLIFPIHICESNKEYNEWKKAMKDIQGPDDYKTDEILKKYDRCYEYDLSYSVFRDVCVRGFIEMIVRYINGHVAKRTC